MEPLDLQLIWADFQRWVTTRPDRISEWFQALPQKAQQWPNQLVEWIKARPDRIKYFFENFQDIMEKKWNKIDTYFRTCDEWEYIGWGTNGIGLIMVVVALIFW